MESSQQVEHQTNEMIISTGVAFPDFGDNFVSVEGILNNDFQELLASASSGRTESLTLYKSEPDPLDNFVIESESVVNAVSVTTDQYNSTPQPQAEGVKIPVPLQNTKSTNQESRYRPDPTPIFGEDEEELRPPRRRNLVKAVPPESTITIPRLLGSSQQLQHVSKITKGVDFFARQNIDEYLMRRGFRQPNDPNRPPVPMLPPDKGCLNTITYGPHYEAQEITGEIEKFWRFYSALKLENIKSSEELKPILVPLLIHFYDECFLAGETAVALRLYTDFGNRFLKEDNTKDNYDILYTISKVSTIDEFEGNELIQYLRRKDYVFVLSNATFERLKTFLRSTGCPALVNLFANRLIIQVAESEVKPTYEEFPVPGRIDESLKNLSETNGESSRMSEKLKSSVLTNLPTLSLYTTNNSPICGAISSQSSMLAYGMANGEIRISFTSKRVLNDVNMTRKRTNRKRRLLTEELSNENVDSGDERVKDHSAINTLKGKRGHTGSVCGLTFHPRTMVLFSVGEDTKMKAWDLHEFECRADYRGHTAPVWCVDQTSSGHMLVTGSMDCTARIWVPERTDYLRMLAGHYFDVDCVKFHPNEAYVGTGSVDKSVRLWSVADGNLVRVFTGMNSSISSIQFHESGRYIVGASDDPMILVWDIAESEVIAEIPCPPFCRDISLTGNMLSACFTNNTILIWNIFPIVGGSGDMYNCDVEDAQSYKIVSPKVYECTDQSKSLLKLFYRDIDNLYCLGEAPVSPEIRRETRKKYVKNPLTEWILAKPNQSKWDDSDSESGSEITSEELSFQPTRSIRRLDSNENDDEVNGYDKDEVYQFYS